MSFHGGDVLIAFVPNADGSPAKVRPVLVVQSDIYNAKIINLLIAAITSNLKNAADPARLMIDVTTPDGQASGLRRDSVVSCINLATITDTLVARKIGQFADAMMLQIDDCLKAATAAHAATGAGTPESPR